MKKRFGFFLIFILLFLLIGETAMALSLPRFAASAPKPEDYIFSPVSANVDYDGYLNMTFTFMIDGGFYDDLCEQHKDLRVYAVACPYSPNTGAPKYSRSLDKATLGEPATVGEGDGKMVFFSITLYGLGREDYDTAYTARLFLVYGDGKGDEVILSSPHRVSENVFTLYDAAMTTYNDRVPMIDEDHLYMTASGDYSSCSDLSALEPCLASHISLEVAGGTVTDLSKHEYYNPIYSYSYEDGVLTIFIEGADIPEGTVTSVKINGRERYFELYEGKIRFGMK